MEHASSIRAFSMGLCVDDCSDRAGQADSGADAKKPKHGEAAAFTCHVVCCTVVASSRAGKYLMDEGMHVCMHAGSACVMLV